LCLDKFRPRLQASGRGVDIIRVMASTHGIGIIGAGVIFGQHMRAFEAMPQRARVLGVAEPDQGKRRRAGDQHFIPSLVEDYRQLLARDDIDIISVCTPPALHEQMVTEALEAGKYVICEKPLVPSLAAADRIAAVAERHPGRLAVVYQVRQSTAARRMRLMVEEGHAGQPLLAKATLLSTLAGTPAANATGWGQWQLTGGGVVMTRMIHRLDLMLHLLGQATEVDAWMDTLANPIESEDTCGATIAFEGGARGTMFATIANQGGGQNEFRLITDRLQMQSPWRCQSNDRSLADRANRRATQVFAEDSRLTKRGRIVRKARSLLGRAVPALKPAPPPSSHEPFMKAVLDAIDQGQPMPVDGAEARRSIELCTAIYTSAITGEAVTLPLDETSRFYEGITPDDYDGQARYRERTGQPADEPDAAPMLPS